MNVSEIIEVIEKNDDWLVQEYIARIPKNKKRNKDEIITLLNRVIVSKEFRKLSYILLCADQDGLDLDYMPIFCQLLSYDWHGCHEDIVMSLYEMRSPEGVECIKIALKHELVEYDDTPYPLTKKCIWALGAIGTPEAIEIIRDLSKSKNYIIRETAELELLKFSK